MERFLELVIVTPQASYCVSTLDKLDEEREFLRKVGERIERIEMRCYEREGGAFGEWGECICKQVIG